MTTRKQATSALARSIRWAPVLAVSIAALAWRPAPRPSFLFMWAGDSAHNYILYGSDSPQLMVRKGSVQFGVRILNATLAQAALKAL
ncbi:MAG TPA: hypothetical protein VGR59_00420 [Gemmatimonadaceae bacterium]|nr:hypothetical protein [Gemmatimonadaceae bacterium]